MLEGEQEEDDDDEWPIDSAPLPPLPRARGQCATPLGQCATPHARGVTCASPQYKKVDSRTPAHEELDDLDDVLLGGLPVGGSGRN